MLSRFTKQLFTYPALLTAVLLVSACGSTPVELEPMELEKIEPSVELDKLWSTGAGSGQDARYTLLEPAVSGDVVFTTDVNGLVQAVDRTDGSRIWRTKLREPVSGGVGAGNGLVLVGTNNAEVIALDAENGTERWRGQLPSEVLSPPQTNGDVVVVQSFDGRLVALDHDTGVERWVYETNMPLLTLRGSATPLVVGSTVYAGFANGKVVALEVDDGLLVWEQRVAIPQGRSELERMVDIDSAPLLVGNILFVVSYQGELVALSRATGRPLWTQPASSFHDLATGEDRVYLTTDNSTVQAYGTSNGQLAWQNEQLLRRKVTAPTSVGGYLAVGEEEGGFLHLLSQSSGEFVARRRIDRGGLRSPMVAVDDVLYIYTNDGNLVALRVSDREDDN